MSFYPLQVSFEKIYYVFREKLDTLFGTRLKEKTFSIAGNSLEQCESREILCFKNPKIHVFSAGQRYKTLNEWGRGL